MCISARPKASQLDLPPTLRVLSPQFDSNASLLILKQLLRPHLALHILFILAPQTLHTFHLKSLISATHILHLFLRIVPSIALRQGEMAIAQFPDKVSRRNPTRHTREIPTPVALCLNPILLRMSQSNRPVLEHRPAEVIHSMRNIASSAQCRTRYNEKCLRKNIKRTFNEIPSNLTRIWKSITHSLCVPCHTLLYRKKNFITSLTNLIQPPTKRLAKPRLCLTRCSLCLQMPPLPVPLRRR